MTDSHEITTQNATVDEWTRALAQSEGAPGGGAGAGVMLAIAASLTSMVAGYTRAEAGQEDRIHDLIERARRLRAVGLRLADDDASASRAFGAAFHFEAGEERSDAIDEASINAARASAELGHHAIEAIDDLAYLADNGNPALIADVVVAFGALKAALTGARTNVSFDLATMRSSGLSLGEIREQHPRLWDSVAVFDRAIARIDDHAAAVDDRAAPTDSD